MSQETRRMALELAVAMATQGYLEAGMVVSIAEDIDDFLTEEDDGSA